MLGRNSLLKVWTAVTAGLACCTAARHWHALIEAADVSLHTCFPYAQQRAGHAVPHGSEVLLRSLPTFQVIIGFRERHCGCPQLAVRCLAPPPLRTSGEATSACSRSARTVRPWHMDQTLWLHAAPPTDDHAR